MAHWNLNQGCERWSFFGTFSHHALRGTRHWGLGYWAVILYWKRRSFFYKKHGKWQENKGKFLKHFLARHLAECVGNCWDISYESDTWKDLLTTFAFSNKIVLSSSFSSWGMGTKMSRRLAPSTPYFDPKSSKNTHLLPTTPTGGRAHLITTCERSAACHGVEGTRETSPSPCEQAEKVASQKGSVSDLHILCNAFIIMMVLWCLLLWLCYYYLLFDYYYYHYSLYGKELVKAPSLTTWIHDALKIRNANESPKFWSNFVNEIPWKCCSVMVN